MSAPRALQMFHCGRRKHGGRNPFPQSHSTVRSSLFAAAQRRGISPESRDGRFKASSKPGVFWSTCNSFRYPYPAIEKISSANFCNLSFSFWISSNRFCSLSRFALFIAFRFASRFFSRLNASPNVDWLATESLFISATISALRRLNSSLLFQLFGRSKHGIGPEVLLKTL